MENDPTELALVCLSMLRYAEAHGMYKGAKDKKALDKLKAKSRLVRTVEANDFAIVAEEIAERETRKKTRKR